MHRYIYILLYENNNINSDHGINKSLPLQYSSLSDKVYGANVPISNLWICNSVHRG